MPEERAEISEQETEFCSRNGIPLPQLSSRERLRNMLYFRNRAYLYHATCALSGKSILSCVPPESGLAIYETEQWDSDNWSGRDYARDYNFRQPFFSQLHELYRRVPRFSRSVVPGTENCQYTNGIVACKNCYLVFSALNSVDCLFSYTVWRSRNIVDCVYVKDSELCFSSADIRGCYNLKFSEHCVDCSDSAFLFQCYSCRSCCMCSNLAHKEYCLRNRQLTKEEYEKKTMDFGSRKALQAAEKEYRLLVSQTPLKSCRGENSENVTGNYITNSRNCFNSFFITNSEDVVDSLHLDGAKNSILHANFGSNSELVYHSVSTGLNVYNLKFCLECRNGCRDLEYCIMCSGGVNDCFGCIGLKKAQYCLLNKQYTKQEYFDLVSRIRGQMRETGEYGCFFPLFFSPYYYNESEVNDFFPLPRTEAVSLGFRWKEAEPGSSDQGLVIPDHIREADDSILLQTLRCRETGTPFKVIKAELEYYRRLNVPLPAVAPMRRIQARLRFFTLASLSERSCAACGTPFFTVESNPQTTVYCGTCFAKRIF